MNADGGCCRSSDSVRSRRGPRTRWHRPAGRLPRILWSARGARRWRCLARTFAVHADLDFTRGEQLNEVYRSELAAMDVYNDLYLAKRQLALVASVLFWSHARRKFFELADIKEAARKKKKVAEVILPLALAGGGYTISAAAMLQRMAIARAVLLGES